MPSGKRARQQRRTAAAAAPPPVRSKGVGGARARQASPRALQIAGGVVLVAVIAIVLGVVLSRGGGGGSSGGSGVVSSQDLDGLGSTGSATSPVALQGSTEANALFKGIPQNKLILGKPTAPVEMQMFIDVQCPICQNYETVYLPTVVQKYIRTGKVQLHLQPWAFLGSQSFTGRLGVIAAAAQDKGYEYAKVLYDNQGTEESGWLDGRMMANIAASVTGLDLQRWRTDVNSAEAQSVAKAVDKLAKTSQVTGTPTVLVGPANGPLRNVLTPAQIAANQSPTLQETERALDAALAH
jgi:protein-disulfide isomerase